MVTQFVEAQAEWIATQESQMLAQTMEFIDGRMRTEMSVTERLVAMVNSCIESNTPMYHQWQLASDAITVCKERLVYPPPDDPIVPICNEFQPSHLNEEQHEYAVKMLDSLQLGGKLLQEDLMSWITLSESGLGPIGHCFGNNGTCYSLVLPKLWRNDHDDLAAKIYEAESIPGTKENTGVVGVDTVMQNMLTYGEGRFEIMKKWTGSL